MRTATAGLVCRVAIATLGMAALDAAHGACRFAPQGEGRVAEIIDNRTFRLHDGREVRLAGIEPIGDAAALTQLIAGRDVTLHGETDTPDRYGRQPAFVFLDDATPRSGQQAAIGADLIGLLDALDIDRAVLAGFDWGGRAACIVAALRPERVTGLVTVDGYNVQQIASANEPAPPAWEATYWYQYYFHGERGRLGLERNRDELCELLWRNWSPTWNFTPETFAASAPSLHNPDFVDVVVHSYRHRFGLAESDPRYDEIEALLAAAPPIMVPTIVLETGADGILGPPVDDDHVKFVGPYGQERLANVGHNVPQQAPRDFARAVLDLAAGA